MDQGTRDEIATATAVHQELGRDYDGAVAEGLVERIGEEIDKRIDVRLGQAARPGPDLSPARGHAADQLARRPSGVNTTVLALGSLAIGGITSVSLMNNGHGPSWLLLVIWLVIGAVNVVYARRH